MFAVMLGGVEIILILGMLLAIPLSLGLLAFWIWMLVHAIQNKGLVESEKVIWVVVIALTHFIGALIYFFAGRPKASTPLPPMAHA
jgi:hypothetical protein